MTVTVSDIVRLIQEIMQEKGIGYNELGRRLGVSSGRISEKLNGKTNWKLTDLFSYAEALGVSPESITAELERRDSKIV
ncbi:MAG: helix-turn-helix domain-containing protein [Propionibacteriaceae bacterium]|nr:helix-turn-helix domain-containing protein [Propionibacteriaceae bacterium]